MKHFLFYYVLIYILPHSQLVFLKENRKVRQNLNLTQFNKVVNNFNLLNILFNKVCIFISYSIYIYFIKFNIFLNNLNRQKF